MGKRLSKIYTRTGDGGTTGLADGSRVAKHAPRIESVGAVDETNSALGLVLAEMPDDDPLRSDLLDIQHDLFEIGAELALPTYQRITDADVTRLEAALDRTNADLPPLEEFVLPGGSRAAAACHVARTACRRAERRACALASDEAVRPVLLSYLNRLSDLLFVCARALARRDGGREILWQRAR